MISLNKALPVRRTDLELLIRYKVPMIGFSCNSHSVSQCVTVAAAAETEDSEVVDDVVEVGLVAGAIRSLDESLHCFVSQITAARVHGKSYQ